MPGKEMRMKPILFNTDMVRAILEGRKTVTRRVVKFKTGQNPQWTGYIPDGPVLYGSNNIPASKSPYHPGDILYVRETWARSMAGTYIYKATDTPIILDRWRPSIHMPKDAARLFLRVTDVRAERLQDMRLIDCMKEGTQLTLAEQGDLVIHGVRARNRFSGVWDSTIKPSDLPIYGWEANPWVWVIEFERVSKEAALKVGDG